MLVIGNFANHWTGHSIGRALSLARLVLNQVHMASIQERGALIGLVLLVTVLTSSVFSPSVFAQGPAWRSCNTIDPPVSHWSADVKIGPGYSVSNGFEASIGGSVEYSVNPLAGLGFQTLYGIRQNALDLLGYGSLNLSNLTAPFRTDFWKRTNVLVVAGGGLRQSGLTSMLLMAGLDGEYNLNDALALQLGGDLLYGLDKEVHITFGLRYKFGVSSMKHAHNISMNEYRPQPSPIIIQKIVWAGFNAASIKCLEVLEASNTELNRSLQDTEDKIKAYKELLTIQEESKAATKAVTKTNSKPAFTVSKPVVVAPLPLLIPVVGKPTETTSNPVVAIAAETASKPSIKGTSPPLPQLKVANVVTGTLNPVEFISGSSQLTPDSKLILQEMASILLAKDWKSLTIIGNTDNQGNPANNLILSLQRASIVRSYLVSKGLPMKKQKIRGDGGSNPIDSNKTPLGRRLNCRVDFVLEN